MIQDVLSFLCGSSVGHSKRKWDIVSLSSLQHGHVCVGLFDVQHVLIGYHCTSTLACMLALGTISGFVVLRSHTLWIFPGSHASKLIS